MIKLLIKQKQKDGTIIEKVVDFEGGYKNGFIIQGTLSWKPILTFDGWEPIKEII